MYIILVDQDSNTYIYAMALQWSYLEIVLTFLLLILHKGEFVSTTTEAATEESGDGDALDWHDSACTDFYGGYARKPNLGLVCCKNQTVLLPTGLVENWDTNLGLIYCTEDFKGSDSPDLATALWNVTYCVLRNSSAFPQNKVDFKSFFKYITEQYPKDIVAELQKTSEHCGKDVEKEKSPVTKLRKYFECFHNSEKKVCDKPYKTPKAPATLAKFDKKYDCPEMVGLFGNDVRDYCCKKQSVPYNFMDFYLKFPAEEENLQKSESCSESFANKQLELDPKLKKAVEKFDNNFDENSTTTASDTSENPRERLFNCNAACGILSTNEYSDKLININFEKVITNLTANFGKRIQNDLKKILTNRKSLIEFSKIKKQKLNFDGLSKKFQGGDQLTKIKYFCQFVDMLEEEIERALHEYCFDKDFADTWFSTHHHP